MRHIVPIALLLLSGATFTHAQSTRNDSPSAADPALPPHTEIANISTSKPSDWPTADTYFSQNIDVVTLAEPAIRHSCHVRTVTPSTITCRSNLHHEITTYQRSNIAALIDPPNHTERWVTIRFLAIAGAALAASFFVPLAASVVLRIATGFILFGAAWDEGGSDHPHDLVLYQSTITPLALKLH